MSLSTARSGASGLPVLRGEAGIGKSALVEYAREQARGLTQPPAEGVESEAELAFAGLTELLGPVTDAVATLPAPQSDVCGAPRATVSPQIPWPCGRALYAPRVLSESAPVLVTVDDAEWVDESSLEALAFAVRRLTMEPVVVIAAVRGEQRIPLGNGHAPPLVLGGLADEERADCSPNVPDSAAAADQLLRVAAGNLLALFELPEIVGIGAAAGGGRRTTAGRSARTAAFRARLDRLPDATRSRRRRGRGHGSPGSRIPRRVRLARLAARRVGPREHAGLVMIVGDRVALRHPLLRPVAYQTVGPPEQREVHAALADALARPSENERRTWHLVRQRSASTRKLRARSTKSPRR